MSDYERQEHFEKGSKKRKGREVYAKRRRRGGVHIVKFGSEKK
jgi:hypothetical protein